MGSSLTKYLQWRAVSILGIRGTPFRVFLLNCDENHLGLKLTNAEAFSRVMRPRLSNRAWITLSKGLDGPSTTNLNSCGITSFRCVTYGVMPAISIRLT